MNERRNVFAIAGAVVLVAVAAVIAIGANVGLFGLTDDATHVGKLSPVVATAPVATPNAATPNAATTDPADSTGPDRSASSSTGANSEPGHGTQPKEREHTRDGDD
jgi:hypothetical protein